MAKNSFDSLAIVALGACGPQLINHHKRRRCIGTPITYDAIGLGTLSDPYLVCNLTQFIQITRTPAAWAKAFLLKVDLDLSGYTETNYTMIGNATTPFRGHFDGEGHTISNFSYNAPAATGVGLFGTIKGARAGVRRLHLRNFAVAAQGTVGALAGEVDRARILNTSATGTVTGSATRIGGLVGRALNGAIISSSSTNVTVAAGAGTIAGGLAGESIYAHFLNSYTTGNVSGAGILGGMVGDATAGIFRNVYTTGNVTGTGQRVGGILGADTRSVIRYAFTAGLASGASANPWIGPIAGDSVPTTYNNLYFVQNCSNSGAGGCNIDGAPTGPVAASSFHGNTGAPLTAWNFNQMWVARSADFDPTKAPLNTWDFNWEWKANIGAPPTLQRGEDL